MSPARMDTSNPSATHFSKASPVSWPNWSLTCLNLSRSMKTAEKGICCRRARASARPPCSSNSRRLAKPVSASWRARRNSRSSNCRSRSSIHASPANTASRMAVLKVSENQELWPPPSRQFARNHVAAESSAIASPERIPRYHDETSTGSTNRARKSKASPDQ